MHRSAGNLSCGLSDQGSRWSAEGRYEPSPPFSTAGPRRRRYESPRRGRLNPLQSGAMSHTYASLLIHCVFSTKSRKPLISEEMQPRLWAYIGGIARLNKFKALAVGGTPDHVHVLLSLFASMPIPKAVQLIKGGSSKWMNDQRLKRTFSWQDGYGVFSIGVSQVSRTIHYINHQKEHHAKLSFNDELKLILKRHGMSFRAE